VWVNRRRRPREREALVLDLSFTVSGVDIDDRAATPTLVFCLGVKATEPVHALALRTRVVIEARRRQCGGGEQQLLEEIFGPRENWARNVGPLTWAEIATLVPSFAGASAFDVRVPCTYDMEPASTKFLHLAVDGDIPLSFLFTGTAFINGPAGIGVVRLSQDLEASWQLPSTTWHEAMERAFPDARWVRLGPESFDRLARYKAVHALPTWDAALDHVLEGEGIDDWCRWVAE
jgi:hypothetical protein